MPADRKVSNVKTIRTAAAALLLASMVTVPVTPAMAMDDQRGRRDRTEDRRRVEREWRKHDARREWRDDRRGDRDRRGWDAARYYRRDDRRYKPRRLGRNDRIYRGYDNRYYCRRDDGTTGLIVGGMAGGVLGHVIAPGGSKTLGTVLGAGAGALIGRAIDRGEVTCR